MEKARLGRTGLMMTRTAFGALPVRRRTMDDAVRILRRAYEAGIYHAMLRAKALDIPALLKKQYALYRIFVREHAGEETAP